MHGLIPDVEESNRQRLFFSAGDRLIEYSKKFLSQYIAYCSENRYNVNHYLMSGLVLRDQKQLRTSFIEEVLEGANQLLVADHELRIINDLHSLSYQHFRDMTHWINDYGQQFKTTRLPMAKKLRDQIKIDHYLGERVHLSMPMQVHIQSSIDTTNSMPIDKFMCLNVILTNHGVYLIDDNQMSFSMDPSNLHIMQAPDRVFSFNYKCIKRLIYGQRLEQRITLKVDVQIEDPWWNISGGNANNTSRLQSGKNTQSKRSSASPQKRKKNLKKNDNGEEIKELFFVTFIVPGMVETLQMRELFEMAVDQAALNADEEDEESDLSYIHSDMLLQVAIMEKIWRHGSAQDGRHCPLCGENRVHRDCKCDFFMGYGFMIAENTKQLGTLSKCTQRGGAVRLLSTDPAKQKQLLEQQRSHEASMNTSGNTDFGIAAALAAPDLGKHLSKVTNASRTTGMTASKGLAADPNAKADFGILLISPTDFWFFQENPGRWEESADGNTQYEKLVKTVHDATETGDGVGSLIAPSVRQYDMRVVESIRIITSRVPAIELEYSVHGLKKTVAFSLMSDF